MTRLKRAAKREVGLLPATEVPKLETEEEAARWYETHDTSQLPSEPVTEWETSGPAPGLDTIAVRVSRREIEELKRRAQRLGIGYTTYVRVLINRHVLDEPPIG